MVWFCCKQICLKNRLKQNAWRCQPVLKRTTPKNCLKIFATVTNICLFFFCKIVYSVFLLKDFCTVFQRLYLTFKFVFAWITFKQPIIDSVSALVKNGPNFRFEGIQKNPWLSLGIFGAIARAAERNNRNAPRRVYRTLYDKQIAFDRVWSSWQESDGVPKSSAMSCGRLQVQMGGYDAVSASRTSFVRKRVSFGLNHFKGAIPFVELWRRRLNLAELNINNLPLSFATKIRLNAAVSWLDLTKS